MHIKNVNYIPYIYLSIEISTIVIYAFPNEENFHWNNKKTNFKLEIIY